MRGNKFSSEATVFVAGHRGLVGSALVRRLKEENFKNIIVRTRSEVDLLDQKSVNGFFSESKVEFVFLCAAKVGGILANKTYPADFLYENLMISSNIIHAAAKYDVKKLLFLGSSCIYPKLAKQPITEDQLLTGPLEATNEAYALAKIVGLKLCEKYFEQYEKVFVSAMPTNLYGPNDNYHPENSHVIPGLLWRFHDAKTNKKPSVTIWGSGKPLREFLFVDDLANALLTLMGEYNEQGTINVGTGEECTIRELAETIRDIVGFKGSLEYDLAKPDGTPRKVLDISKIKALGWQPKYSLREGLQSAYSWALQNEAAFQPLT